MTIDDLVRRLPLVGNSYVVGLAAAALPFASPDPAPGGSLGDLSDVVAEMLAGGRHSGLERALGLAAARINAAYFRFDIHQLHDDGGPRIVELTPGLDGRAELPGTLVDSEHATRKLTVVFPLLTTVAPGSALVLPSVGKERPIEAGSALLYPAFVQAEVILPESISCLITHACGPTFR